MAKVALRAGLTPDSVTIIGTAGTVIAALTLFPIGQLWWGAVAVSFFVLADMLDGAMARVRGGGTRFGAVLDATCDRIGDGAVFCGLLWWVAFGLKSPSLVVAILICLVTSQVISYIKARAEASGLRGDGGLIERPERLMIVLVGAGLSGSAVLPADLAASGRDVAARGGQPDHGRAAAALGPHVARRDGHDREPGEERALISTREDTAARFSDSRAVAGSASAPTGDTPRAGAWCARCRICWPARRLTPELAMPHRAAVRSSCGRTWPG